MNLDNVPKFCTKCGSRLELVITHPRYDAFTGEQYAGSFVIGCPDYSNDNIIEHDIIETRIRETIPFQEAQKQIVEKFGRSR